MAPYAVSGGRVEQRERLRDDRGRDDDEDEPAPPKHRRRRSSRRGEGSRPRPTAAPTTTTTAARRSTKYEPLRPTVRAVPAERSRRREPAVVDGSGDTPDARLMGGSEEREEPRKKRKKSTAAAAAAAAAVAEPKRHKSGSAARGRERSRGKRPFSVGSEESVVKSERKRRCGKCFWILAGLTLLLLVILIPVGVLVVGKKKEASSAAPSSSSSGGMGKYGEESSLPGQGSIPSEDKNSYLDPYTWLDTTDFNLTYTNKMVGGLSIMGLFDEYDDSTQANENVPPLNQKFDYGKMPIRGVNIGGWLIIEPFITPSFFKKYSASLGIVDEYTLSKELGAKEAKETVETHYKSFVTEQTFKEIRDAGLDHVRIPFGYWVVETFDDDTFVPKVSWRYLLRAIEWARKYGLRVKVDLHSVPGGANGWNHSGRLGVLEWLSGPNGDKNGVRTLEIHTKLARFFSQPRYKNIVTMYGLVNEPKMITLDPNRVIKWTEQAYDIVRDQGYEGYIIFGDGFRGLSSWKGAFSGREGMLLDVHQYVIFNTQQISLTHTKKIQFACSSWGAQILASNDKSTGFGPTMVGEWGQADTDCTEYLNNVGVGSRWEGTLNLSEQSEQVMNPCCPGGKGCSCEMANGDPSDYSEEYRKFLRMFAEAQMHAFENGWGWLYWTWDTESSTQWSYKKSLAAKIIPQKAYKRDFNCEMDNVPDFGELGLPETN